MINLLFRIILILHLSWPYYTPLFLENRNIASCLLLGVLLRMQGTR